MPCARLYLDEKTMIRLNYACFYPHHNFGIEFHGYAANYHINQTYLFQKADLRIISKIIPRVMSLHILKNWNNAHY